MTNTIETPIPLADALLIPYSMVRANPNQPRQTYNDETLEELRESIREHGILQPLIVRFEPSKYDGTPYIIQSGERRFRASEGVLTALPCIIQNTDEKTANERALIENIQREDLTAYEEAVAVKNLMTLHELSIKRAAIRLGKSTGWVNNRLALLKTGDDVKEVAKETPDAMSALLTVDKVKEPEARAELLEEVKAGAPLVEIKARVDAYESAVEAQKKAASMVAKAPDAQTQARLVSRGKGEASGVSRGRIVTGGATAREAKAECSRALGNLNAWVPHLSDDEFEKVKEFARRVLRGDLSR